MGGLSAIILLMFPVAIIALVIWVVRRGGVAFDVRQTYFYLVALITLVITFFAAVSVVSGVFAIVFANAPIPRNSDTWQQIAGGVGMFLVAAPMWWFHWRAARRRAFVMKRLLALRIYLYAVTVIALVAVVIIGGMVASEILKALFGLVDFSSVGSTRAFWKDELTAMVNLLIAIFVWFYHWRAVGHVPADENLEALHA